MMRLMVCICVLTAGVLSISVISANTAHKTISSARSELPNEKTSDVLTILLTGNELGMLKPCGCSGGQLGGLEKRSAVLNSVPPAQRLIVDTGSLVEDDDEQSLIKFRILIQAFNLLGYDVVNLSREDIEIAENLGLLDGIDSAFSVISFQGDVETNLPAKFTKQFSLQEGIVAVTVAAFDTESDVEALSEHIGELFASEPNVQSINILILNYCDSSVVDSAAETGIVDCLICPAESDEPMVIGDPDEKPLVISVGRYGKYVGKLEVRDTDIWSDKISFSAVPVTEDLPQEESLVELYRIYQQLVKEENLLERQLRFSLPRGLKYTGSAYCELCHDYEYEKWSANPHADAYATLEEVGSQYDPECIVCHVVGFGYESGFISEDATGHLKDVGCESCHGPGLEHIQTLGKAETRGPMLDCSDCHTPEQSAEYAENEQLYLEKIIHWREPNLLSNVQK